MQKRNKSFTQTMANSFGFAFQGIRVLLTERNFRVHLLIAVLVVSSGVYFQLSTTEWCIITLLIGLILTAEAFNSALEQVCNRITTDHDPLIRRIKDISAGAVLILAISSAIIGLIIFLPKIT